MKHIISVTVENKFGVLARIAGLFSARGFNISSLAVGETEDPTISRMTIVVKGNDRILEQVKKQLNKLIDVIFVKDYVKKDHTDRELILFKVAITQDSKDKVLALLEKYSVDVIKVSPDDVAAQIVGEQDDIDKLFSKLEEFGIKEMMRTGRIAMEL